MSINIGPPSVEELRPRITVIGVGGAGGNAIANMIESQIEGVDFIVANTDAQALNNAVAEHRIQLGPEITQGLGAGSRPEVGRAAAEETFEEIERALDGVNMVFIAAGMGGGTGTGAAPVIAEVARRKGILTVGVVTKPFLFEGTRRMRAAEAGIDELQQNVDTLIVIPNQNLFLVAKADTTFKEAFVLADEVLQQGVRSITDLMVMPGLINLDFADIRSVMNEMGKAMMGTGEGEGDNRALEAAERAIANPLLDGVSMQGAKGVIISIIGGEDMRLLEVDEAANHIRELVDPEANIIWGSAFNPDLDGKIRVSVVATGIEQGAQSVQPAPQPISLGAARGPKKPALPLPTADEIAEGEAQENTADDGFGGGFQTTPAAEGSDSAGEAAPVATTQGDDSPLDFSRPDDTEASEVADADDGEVEAEADNADPFASLSGTAFGREAGNGNGFAAMDDGTDDGADDDMFELTQELGAEDDADDQDELLLDASRLANADEPVGGSAVNDADKAPAEEVEADAPPKASGSTLFERMANLTSGSDDDDEEEEDGGSAMRIPRFLGRQNNQ